MLKNIIALASLATMFGVTPLSAQPSGDETRWLRYATISPNGETVSFTSGGQIFVVPVAGGVAIPISSERAYSHKPVWSNDSTFLAFASDLAGDDDVYVTDFSGSLRRMTFSSAAELPTSISPDGNSVLFEALRLGDAEASVQGALSSKEQLYTVDLETGRERLLLPNMAHGAVWDSKQTKLAYYYDPSQDPTERQFRVVANARQLWIYSTQTGQHERVFPIDGVDRLNPVWSADDSHLYYLSEKSGRLNVWKYEIVTGVETQLTDQEDAIRYFSVSQDGTIAYNYNGRILVKAPSSDASTPIEIMTLHQRSNERTNQVAMRGQGFATSPDGELFAHVAGTDIFLADKSGNYRRITDTAGEERDLAFSPNGEMLIYAAQRDHKWGLYGVSLKQDDGKTGLALTYEERVLHAPLNGNAMSPKFSPDSNKIAFLADRREVRVMDVASGEVTTLFGEGDYNSSYADGSLWFNWAPNSKQLAVDWNTVDATGTRKAAIVPADGSTKPQQIGRVPDFGYYIWTADGTQLVGMTSLYAARDARTRADGADLYRVFVSEQARHDFLDRVDTPNSDTSNADANLQQIKYYAPDSYRHRHLEGRVAQGLTDPLLLAPLADGRRIFAPSFDGESVSLNFVDLATGEFETTASIPAPDLLFVDYVPNLEALDIKLAGQILRVPLNAPQQHTRVDQKILFTRDEQAARVAAFEQVWADIKYRYYDAKLEGRDWDKIGQKYRVYLGSITSDRELKSLLSAMLGELSASHLFVGYSAPESTIAGLGTHNDVLGIYLDYGHEGQGRRVVDILTGGPLDRPKFGLNAGDVLVSINGQLIPEAGGIDKLLDLNAGRKVTLGILDDGKGLARHIEVTPTDGQNEWQLSRTRLIEARNELVQRLSNNCIVYHHIPKMYNEQYLDLLATLSTARGVAKAALIDVRSNTGGNLTRELITLLTGKSYATIGRDDGPKVADPENRWLWPSAVLVDSFGYSDGSVFPQAYQDNAIGNLVGDPVLNTGTAVNYVVSKILPGLTYGIPVLPIRRLDGTYYENHLIEPEISVPFDPNNVGINNDPQLEAGIASLMAQIGAEADCR